jgi:hypothetical protein
MKYLSLISLGLWLILPLQALSLEELQASYESRVVRTSASREKSIASLQVKYLKAILPAKNASMRAGKLKEALLIDAEIKEVKKGNWPLPALEQSLVKALGKKRTIFTKSRSGIELKWAMAYSKDADAMLVALIKKRDQLTKAADLKTAQKAQSLIDQIMADPQLALARELPFRISVDGQTKVAMILRRNGDNLEPN